MSQNPSFPKDFFFYSSALMCVIDAEGFIVQTNPAWQKKLNISQTEMEYSHYLAWIHPADKEQIRDKLAQMGIHQPYQMEKKRPKYLLTDLSFSTRWCDCQDHYRWFNWEITAISGEFKTFYAVATEITAQKQTEQILHEKGERFELAIRGSNHGLWDWNLKTNEIYLSPRWKHMLGYEDHEMANHLDEWCRFVHPDDFPKMWATIEAYLDKNTTYYEDIYRVYHKNGDYRWVLARAAALWDEADQPYRMVGTYADITENKRIEQALQESEALLSAIFDVTQIGLCVTDEQGHFIRVNPAFCELYGYPAEELLGQHFTLTVLPKDHERVLKLHQAILDGDQVMESAGEWRIQNKAGHYLEVSFTMGLLTQHNGRRLRVTTITDITKRKHAEAERNRLFNFSLDMQSIIGFDLCFKEINAAWEHTLGWSEVELSKRTPLSLVHPDDKSASLQIIQQLIQGHSVSGFENRCLCKDGSYKWLSWNVYPLVEQQSMYVVTRDMTERKKAEEEIKQQRAFIHLVVDSVPNLIFIKDPAGQFIFVNQSVAQFLGTSIEELIENKNWPLIQNQPLYSQVEYEVIEQQQEIAFEETYCSLQGEKHCFQMIKKPFVQIDGQVLVLSVGTDITERKQHEEALRLSETRYRAIVQDQIDLICRFRANGILTFVNQAYCRYFGKTEAELLGQSFIPLMFQGDHRLYEELLTQITSENPVVIGEYRAVLPDGSIHWQQWIDRALFDAQGEIVEYQAVGRDITERKQAEEALRHSEEHLRLLTNAAQVILFAIDKKGVFTLLRGKVLETLELIDDELVGQSIFDIFAAWPEELKYMNRALLGETVTTIITTLPYLVLETKLTPLFDEQQNVLGVIGVSIDITERHSLEVKLKETVAELETILDNSVVGIAYLKNSHFIRVNHKLESLLGYAQDELCGLPFHTIYPSLGEYRQMKQQALSLFEQGKEYDTQCLIKTKKKEQLWSRLVGKAVESHDLGKGSIWMIEDITLQRKAEQHLRLTATIFETSANGIMVTDAQNCIQRVNPAFSKITGYSQEEVQGKKTSYLSSGQHDKQFYQTLWKSIKNTGHWQGEIWNRKKNGELYVAWLSISAIPNDIGPPAQYMAVLTDLSRLQEEIENVRYLASYDSLTRLPNRMLFQDNLLQAIKLANRNHRLFALLFIDLDGFKPVNDRLGHAMGDQLLQSVASRLQGCVRETDSVARLGGDEFTVILNNIKKIQDAARITTHILQRLQQPFQFGEHQVRISASIGISLYPQDSLDIEHLIKQADTAMYQAKHAGKGQFRFYELVEETH